MLRRAPPSATAQRYLSASNATSNATWGLIMIGVFRYSAAIIAVPLAIAFGGVSTEILTWTAAHWPTSDVGLFIAGCIGGLIGCINLLVFGLWRAGRRANTV